MATASAPSKLQAITTWLALAVAFLLLLYGVFVYGISIEVHQRFWNDIFARAGGPMTFRFLLQPSMALLAAIPDGLRDARAGRSGFFWNGSEDPKVKHGRLREGLYAISRTVLLGLCMDTIYQFKVLDHFYPVEALMMAILLALIPYFIFRWIVEQIACRWRAGKGTAS
jgi:hypothetical protein